VSRNGGKKKDSSVGKKGKIFSGTPPN